MGVNLQGLDVGMGMMGDGESDSDDGGFKGKIIPRSDDGGSFQKVLHVGIDQSFRSRSSAQSEGKRRRRRG